MDAVIRAARLSALPKRLSELLTLQAGVNVSGDTASEPPRETQAGHTDPGSLRDQLERQVRAELAAQFDELYESERARARAEGHAQGVTEGQAAAATELAQACERLAVRANKALAAMAEAHRAALAKLESSVGEVAFAAVCRLVSSQALSQPFVLGLIERTCTELRADLEATARLHPRDIEVLCELLQDDELRVDSLSLHIVPDDSLALGGCVIEAASGRFDGGLENQLRRLHAVLAAGFVAK
jgi:flagellar assembly protein FliH